MIVDWTKFEAAMRGRYARSSADDYCRGAREFMAWVGHELGAEDLQLWADHLVANGRPAATVQVYLRGCNILLEWLRLEGHALPAFEPLRLPRVWRRALVPAELAEQYRAKIALSEPYRTCVLLAPEVQIDVFDWARWRTQHIAIDRELRAWTLTDPTGIRVATLGRFATTTLTHYIQNVRPMLDGYKPAASWLFPHPRGDQPIECTVVHREARRVLRELGVVGGRRLKPKPRKDAHDQRPAARPGSSAR